MLPGRTPHHLPVEASCHETLLGYTSCCGGCLLPSSCAAKVLFDAEVTGVRRVTKSGSLPKAEVLGYRSSPAAASGRPDGDHSRTAFKIACDYVVAADGASSSLREKTGLKLSGRRGIGYLVNIHFRCRELARFLKMESSRRPAMLYFVYNEACERWRRELRDTNGPRLGTVRSFCLMGEISEAGGVFVAL